jgi:pyruvate dehydrogenase E2 component (dihydrolipoamide acetyltransferase)
VIGGIVLMIKEVILAKIGLTMETGIILKWLKKEGDFVEQGDKLLEVETDKVTTVVEAFHPGYIKGCSTGESQRFTSCKTACVGTWS